MLDPITTRPTRRAALAGPAFAAFFVLSVVASSPPANSASDAKWVANYTGHGHQIQHVVTGIALVLAGLSLMIFLTGLWRRIADRRLQSTSPLPLAAAAAAAACMAAGGVSMAVVSFTELGGRYPIPSADLLRLTNGLGFGLAGLAGMWAAAISVAVLSAQGAAAGVISRRMMIFGQAVAAVLVLSFLFVPILALLVWAVVSAVGWLRDPAIDMVPAREARISVPSAS